MNTPPVPASHSSLSPYLIVKGGVRAIAFYAQVFGATELYRMELDDGRIGHAELRFGDGVLMLADEFPEHGAVAPAPGAAAPVTLHVYVPDADATVSRAVAAGATVLRPVADQFYGDRSGQIVDPFGHRWHVATHVEDLSPEEIRRRMKAAGAA